MPASPSFPSDGRGKWRKRKRDNSRRTTTTKHHQDDGDDDDEEDLDNDENLDHHEETSDHNAPDPGLHEAELLSAAAVRCSDFPLVLRRAVDRPHASVLAIAALELANHFAGGAKSSPVALENVSHGQLQALSAVPLDCAALDHDNGSSSYVATPPPIMDGCGVVKWFGTRCLVVPMHSDWFSPATVHRLERQVVPHFFSGKFPEHTPEKYMEYRNYIVAKYMENPEKQLAASDFLGLIAGSDSEDLNRIVRFLDHWGIINYCALVPTREPWSQSSYLREESAGEISVPSAALKSIDSLIKFNKPKCKLKASEAYSTMPGRLNDDGDLDDRIRERLSENHCHCCSRPLPNVCYQSNKDVEIMLCSDCFHDGRFVIGHSSLDFTQTDVSKDHGDIDGESWTDQETLLLLEAVELHNENWNEIAELVGTKSKAQCILHFLRLPVEDGLLENIEFPGIIPVATSNQSSNGDIPRRRLSSSNGVSAGPVGDQEEADLESGFPFVNSGNPVMALVAFLASSVGPRVAAACAHACLGVLAEGSDLSVSETQLQNEGLGHNNRLNLENMHGRDIGHHGEIENSVHQKEENSDSRGLDEAGSAPLSEEKVKAAAKAGLAAAAMKAKLFADHEEREIQRLSANIINHQLKRLELKLKQFAEVETFLMKECEQLERTRQRLFSERSRFMATQMGGGGASVGPTGGGGPSSSARPQMMSAQPSMSGYSTTNQQPPHQQPPHQQQAQQQQAHMAFMPRQPMFGMGPRLPLSALQPTSSASSNSMFNNNSNNPPGNRPMLRPVHGTGSGLG